MLCTDPSTGRVYFTMQHLLVGFCLWPNGMRLPRGTTWIFKYNLSREASFKNISMQ